MSWSVVVNCHRCIPCPPTSGRRWAAHHAGELGGGPRRFRENQPLLEAGARDACADRGTKNNLDSAHYPRHGRYRRPVAAPTPPTFPTLADAVEQWLTVKTAGRGLSPHTVRAYRADVATFAAHLHGVSPTDRGVASRVGLSELTPGQVTPRRRPRRQHPQMKQPPGGRPSSRSGRRT